MISFNSRLKKVVSKKQSWLCVGLDINPEALNVKDLNSVKNHTFKVIDATRDFAVAYKPNFAFFERWGSAGFSWLEETVDYIGTEHIKIADAKRGDIGNTAKQYSKSIFNHFGFDSVTINPFMGLDSISPFIENKDKGAFVLCRTSNNSAKDFQDLKCNKRPLYENIAFLINKINKNDNLGLVVGATVPEELENIRVIVPELPILIPGVGAQGGDLEKSLINGNKTSVGIINISRSISFVGDMSEMAIHSEAEKFVKQMRKILN